MHVNVEESGPEQEATAKQGDIPAENSVSDSQENQPVSCNVCSKVFQEISMLSIHMWLHNGQDRNLDEEIILVKQERVDTR